MRPYIITAQTPPFFPDHLIPDETGLVALGGRLSDEILIEAYSKGIFPWSGENPIPWYSPDPRLILIPDNLHVSQSLSKLIKNGRFSIKTDTNFENIIRNCAQIDRKHQAGTWIDNNIVRAYTKLFHLSIAHSIEVYDENELCGGLYGIALGKCFFGESMFSRVSNASKIALYYLCRILKELNFLFIDCQQVTPHMLRLGAVPVSRMTFHELLSRGLSASSSRCIWDYNGDVK